MLAGLANPYWAGMLVTNRHCIGGAVNWDEFLASRMS